MRKSTNTTDYKLTIGDMLFERRYLIKRWIANHARTVLYRLMPNWLVRETFMYAQRYIADNEVVPEVEFMTVFKRICENDVVAGTRVT